MAATSLLVSQASTKTSYRLEYLSRRAPEEELSLPPVPLWLIEFSCSSVGKANRVLLSFDKNHHYAPRLRRTFSSLD